MHRKKKFLCKKGREEEGEEEEEDDIELSSLRLIYILLRAAYEQLPTELPIPTLFVYYVVLFQ